MVVQALLAERDDGQRFYVVTEETAPEYYWISDRWQRKARKAGLSITNRIYTAILCKNTRRLVIWTSYLTTHLKAHIFHFKKWTRLLLSGLSLTLVNSAAAIEFSINGDIRASLFSLHRDDRDGKETATHEIRVRPRVGLGAKFNKQWRMQVRFAGRYSTDGNKLHFEIFNSIPEENGLRHGDSTLDEIYAEYNSNNAWQMRVGRFQSVALLKGVAEKSLDREDSPFTNITWTDGVQVRHNATNGWVTTAIAQYNDAQGATQVRRPPLNFRDDGSRLSYFVSVENTQKVGPLVQRTVDITWLPDALHSKGVGASTVHDYWGIVGRLAAQWPMTESMKFMLSGEVGYAPIVPDRSAMNTGTSGSANGFATQVSLNFIDIVPQHSVGFAFGRVGDGWLLSPTFNNNVNQAEIRYKWVIDNKQTVEVRLRYNKDIRQHINMLQKREDIDYFLRYTYRF